MLNAEMQTLLAILDNSQWKSPLESTQKIFRQTHRLIRYVYDHVPFYRKFYAGIHIRDGCNLLADLPVLNRDLIQSAGNELLSEQLPEQHGNCYPMETSGSTGKPVRIIATDFTRLFYDALMLREHFWHKRDFTKKLMSIRWTRRGFAEPPIGHTQSSWGPPINQYHSTGSGVFINVASETKKQIDALLYHCPQYLLSYPSQLAALAEHCLDNNINMSFLEEIRTTGETMQETYSKVIKQAWSQAKISDVYSCVEIGIVAQQCSEYHQYHVNQENVIVEIVDEENRPCKSGVTGRILLTGLMNYATPLIRYEIGDYAEWGDPCACGRGLPVIKKIHGRKRNRLVLPNGESLFPYLGEREERRKITDAVRKFQFVQHSTHDVEYKVVVSKQLTKEQEEELKKMHQKSLGYPFNIILTYVDDIPAGPGGKFEEFISFVHQSRQT